MYVDGMMGSRENGNWRDQEDEPTESIEGSCMFEKEREQIDWKMGFYRSDET